MPSIADVFITLLPETSKVAEGIRKAVREADNGLPKLHVDADTTQAEEQIEKTVRKPRKPKITPEADTKKAEEELDKTSRDRDTKIKVTVDNSQLEQLNRLIGSGNLDQAGSFSKLLSARMEYQRLLQSPVNDSNGSFDLSKSLLNMRSAEKSFADSMQQDVSEAVNTGVSSGGSAGLSALSPALLGVGVIMAGGIASALSGLAGLVPAALLGGGAVIGTLATGLSGVKEAWDSAGKAAASSGTDQAAKAKEVASAQKELRDAVMSEEQAQKDVATARKDALTQLRDLNMELHGGALDEKQAQLDALKARQDLATGTFKTALDYEQAQLRVEEADQRVAETHQRNLDLQTKANDERAKGVDGADNVVRANQTLAKSQEQVAAAQTNLGTATSKISSAAATAAQDMAKLSPNAQLFVQALQGLKPVWDALKFSVQDSLFANIGTQVQQLATQYFPLLQSAMSGMAGTMNQAFGQLAQLFSKPETMAMMQGIFANIGSSFQVWARALTPFVDGFLRFSQVGSSFLPQLAGMVLQGADAFDRFSKSGDLRQWMQTAMTALGQVGQILPIVGRMFMDLAPIGLASLGFIKTLLDALAPAVKPFAGAMSNLITNGLTPLAAWLGRLGTQEMPHFIKGMETLTKDVGYLVNAFDLLSKILFPPFLQKLGEWIDKYTNPLKILADTGDAISSAYDRITGKTTQSGDLKAKAQAEINRQRAEHGLPPVQMPGGPALSADPGTLNGVAIPGVTPGALSNRGGAPTAIPGVAGVAPGSLSTKGTASDPVYTAPVATPSGSTGLAPSDAALLAGVPAGRYSQDPSRDLFKGLSDCSSSVGNLVNVLEGNSSTSGGNLTTGNAATWLPAHGFLPNTTGANIPGAFNVGYNDHHMQATLPGGTNWNYGSDAAAAKRGIDGGGAFDPAQGFNQHYYLPGGMPGMPNTGTPGPTGAPNDPYFMQYPDGYKPPGPDMGQLGQQMGGDIWSSILPDGFKNPTQFGGMKFLTGLMGGLLGMPMGGSASGAGKGQPASYWAGGGAGGGGGGGAGGLLSGLMGIASKPFGQLQIGSPGNAPGEFMPGMPTSGDAMASPFGAVGQAGTAGPGNNGQVIDNSINVNNPMGQQHFDNMVTTAQQAQVPRQRQGMRPLP